MKGCKNRGGFAMIMGIFMIILVGTMFIIIANASNTIAAQTKAVYKDAVKSNLAASEVQLKKSPLRSKSTEVSR